MNKTFLAISITLMLAGGAATTASAQYYYESPVIVVQGDADLDGIPNRYDNYDPRYSTFIRTRSRGRVVADRDCDGIPDRFDHSETRNTGDRDCDGISNRYDHRDTPTYRASSRTSSRYYTYAAPAYVEPYGYTYGQWQVGSYLPAGYYGSSYYIDYEPYGLAPPPYGHSWVRVGGDVYLVSTRNGLIADVVYSLFR